MLNMKRRRIHKKDEYLGLRLPKADKDALEVAAKETLRDPSDLAWVFIREGLERQQQKRGQVPLLT
jgi:hypothetical protein